MAYRSGGLRRPPGEQQPDGNHGVAFPTQDAFPQQRRAFSSPPRSEALALPAPPRSGGRRMETRVNLPLKPGRGRPARGGSSPITCAGNRSGQAQRAASALPASCLDGKCRAAASSNPSPWARTRCSPSPVGIVAGVPYTKYAPLSTMGRRGPSGSEGLGFGPGNTKQRPTVVLRPKHLRQGKSIRPEPAGGNGVGKRVPHRVSSCPAKLRTALDGNAALHWVPSRGKGAKVDLRMSTPGAATGVSACHANGMLLQEDPAGSRSQRDAEQVCRRTFRPPPSSIHPSGNRAWEAR